MQSNLNALSESYNELHATNAALVEALEAILAWAPSGDGVEEGYAALRLAKGE